MRYDNHFLLDCNEAINYTKEKGLFSKETKLVCQEIGDGNINYIFRVKDEKTGKSIVLKQADKLLRSSGRNLSLARSQIEANILEIESKLAPNYVPKIYLYDEAMCVLAMEDISNYKNLRLELMKGKIFQNLAENIAEFLSTTLLLTTDLFMDNNEKKENVKKFINPELCAISECLVFTEPYNNNKSRNIISEGNEDFVERKLYKNLDLQFAVLKLKEKFMTYSQSLIHGDLHSGSIFINENGIKIIDPEFSFYGPMAYDIGNVLGNLYFPLYRAKYFMENSKEFVEWLEETIKNIPELFYIKSKKLWNKIPNNNFFKNETYFEYYIKTILEDSLKYAGTEIIRRVVGDSKVLELTSLKISEKKLEFERELINKAISLLIE
ncbi:S-methyl-5-thioribose kinase [Fusobacterium massiliense]|uniref:S-methyl-5-thioribose kinase n=1 Tax=Fusobacterium massiliense TaxID=1852365 RepID=UPI0028EC77C8|nr:S-methyl-5-thioribose kinase [Fusobacterium massiliense]